MTLDASNVERRRQGREAKGANAELIMALQKLPPDAPALRGDPEWGVLHVKDVQLADVIISVDSNARSGRRLRRAS